METLQALAHPVRLEILELLRDGEACVCHIQANLEIRQAYLSQQLAVMYKAGLLDRRKSGLRVYYRVADSSLFALIDSLETALHSIGKAANSSTGFPSGRGRQPCSCPQCAAQGAD
jgi:ArsR family transcriptional regulator